MLIPERSYSFSWRRDSKRPKLWLETSCSNTPISNIFGEMYYIHGSLRSIFHADRGALIQLFMAQRF